MRFKLLIAFLWLSTPGFASEIVVDSDGTVYRCDNECVETGGQFYLTTTPKDSNQNVETPHLVSVSSDGRMYVSSEVFADVVNSENFNQRADELVYGHNAIKTQEAYEIEAELERLLFSDSRFTDQSLEVTYFKCSNDYCVLSVDAGSEDDANSFFSYFAHPEHDYANLIMGGGAFSILNSEGGASARLAFGISEKFR